MSQALKNFENHQFHKTWQSFKDEFNKGYNPEQINDPVRLENYDIINKKIEFIDNWLALVDPELGNNDNILSNANNHINNTKSNINSEQACINRNDYRNATNSLNNCINNTGLCVVEIFKLPISIPKVTSHSITRMLNNYRDTIQQALVEINLEKTKNDAIGIKNYKQELIDNENSISKTIEKEFKEIENKYNEINKFYKETLFDDKNTISTKQEILKGKESIFNEIEKIKNRIDNFNGKLDELNKFYENIFGSSEKPGLEQELENRTKQLDEMKERHNAKLAKMEIEYNDTNKRIQELIGKATDAGLAKAFSDEKKEYLVPIRWWNGLFIGNIVALLAWGCFLIWNGNLFKVILASDVNSNNAHFIPLESIASMFLQTSLVTMTLIWFAIYSSKRRSENRRLKQEYAHKETIALSYSSYKDQIDKLKNIDEKEKDKLLSQLMSAIIETIAYNPSKTLDKKHGDGTVLNEVLNSTKEIPNTLKELLEIVKTLKK